MDDPTAIDSMQQKRFRHPLGLYVRSFTEFWERLSYCSMPGSSISYRIAPPSSA